MTERIEANARVSTATSHAYSNPYFHSWVSATAPGKPAHCTIMQCERLIVILANLPKLVRRSGNGDHLVPASVEIRSRRRDRLIVWQHPIPSAGNGAADDVEDPSRDGWKVSEEMAECRPLPQRTNKVRVVKREPVEEVIDPLRRGS